MLAAAPHRDDPHRPRRRAAQPTAPTPCRPASTWRWRSACPAAPCSGYGTLTGQGNGQGGREHGQKADQLPGYRKLDDPAARAHVAAVWGVDPDELPGPGVSAYEMLDRLGTDGGVRALLVLASNIGGLRPERRGTSRERLDALDLLVRLATSSCPRRPRCADVVLPTAQWAEEDGTMTNLEGRVLRRRRALDAARRACAPTWRSCASWPTGSAAASSSRPTRDAVFEELRRASAGGLADYAGITWTSASTPSERRVLALPDGRSTRAPRGCSWTRFATPDGRARFHRVEHRGRRRGARRRVPVPADDRPAAARTTSPARRPGAARRCRGAEPAPYVELHPDLARTARRRRRRRWSGCAPGAAAPCSRARLTAAIRLDTVFVPFHWGGAAARNALTNPRARPARPGCRSSRSAPSPCAPAVPDPDHERTNARCTARRGSCRASSTSRATGSDKPALLHPSLTLHGARRRDHASRSTSAAATPPTSWSPGAGPRRRADALLPDRRQGRHARAAGRGRGPRRTAPCSSCTSPRRRGSPAPSSSTSAWWRSER